MARRKGKKKRKDDAAPPKDPGGGAQEVGTSLKALLSEVRLEPEKDAKASPAPAPKRRPKKKAPEPPAPPPTDDARPSDTLRGADRIAWFDAYAGVRPIGGKRRAVPGEKRPPEPTPAPAVSPADEEVRDRLAALVSGGIRFELERDDDEIWGRRAGAPAAVAHALQKKGVVPEATLDLHGLRADEAERQTVRFVRAQHRRGVRRLCLVHGKGLHSEGGAGVLRDRVIHALTDGGAAPVVSAFASAPAHLGGTGALIVELVR